MGKNFGVCDSVTPSYSDGVPLVEGFKISRGEGPDSLLYSNVLEMQGLSGCCLPTVSSSDGGGENKADPPIDFSFIRQIVCDG